MLLKVSADLYQAELDYIFGDREFYLDATLHALFPELCNMDKQLCDESVELLMGPSANLNESKLPFYFNYEPNPTSAVNMMHW